MATGWAGDNAVNEQIDATVKDGIRRAQSRVPQDRRRAGLQYPAYAFASPAKRVTIGTPPIFPATTAAAARTANCASSNPRSQITRRRKLEWGGMRTRMVRSGGERVHALRRHAEYCATGVPNHK